MAVASAVTIAAATATAVTTAPAYAAPNPAMAVEAAKGKPVVTLVTGDKVVVDVVRGDAEFVPAEGRERVGYRQYVERDAVYVVPDDAAALIADGTLDKRLFNVTALVEAGYHDGARDDVPVLVSYRENASPGIRARTTADGAAVETRSLAAISGAALETEKTEAKKFWDSVRPMLRPGAEIERLWLDAPVKATLAESVPQIGADTAWNDHGLTGKGVRVAVLDTGIDASHPDLADAVVEAEDFTGTGSTDDENGHGTHVAGIITGDGDASDGRYRGVAPDAELVIGKVLNEAGSGQESWILAGMEWAANNASVVNMSLGGFVTDGTDPMSEALNRLTEETGALFVVAAGNAGPGATTVTTPGSADAALTVGAVTKNDELADFSSRGPRAEDRAVKPDVTAPGVDIVSAQAGGTQLGDPVAEGYVALSGTSMASPHVAGAAALLAQQHTEWDADELKAALLGSARAHEQLGVFEQGAGRIDVPAALGQSVLASPASLSLGVVEWPHTDDEPLRKTITYTNVSDEPVTLDLTGELSGPDGATPAGMITVEPARLTVPAGGEAEATVTVDTTVGGPDGLYGGTVTAKSEDTTVITPISVEQEVESYRLDLTVLDRDGKVAKDPYVFLMRHDGQPAVGDTFETGEISLRLPKAGYFMEVRVDDEADSPGFVSFYEPAVEMDGDRALVLDARTAVPFDVSVDVPDAEIGSVEVRATMRAEDGSELAIITGATSAEDMYFAPSQTTHETFEFTLRTEHARPDGNGGYANSPYAIHLSRTEKRGVPDELTYEVSTDELAKVTSVHTDVGAGVTGQRELVSGTLPFTLTEYYTPGVRWDSVLWLSRSAEENGAFAGQLSHTEVFEPGDNGTRWWNTPVFGPAFPRTAVSPWAGREGNLVWVDAPLHSESAPGSSGFFAASGSTKLYRDGDLYDESDQAGFGYFEVPEEAGEYRLVAEADASDVTSVSRVVKAEWIFRSQHEETSAPLPLLAVRFAPELGEDHAARAGEELRIPVWVERNGSDETPELASLSVEVSFDGGRSWEAVPYEEGAVTVTAPEGTRDVSLRAVAKDVDGNDVKQTIVGAYPVK